MLNESASTSEETQVWKALADPSRRKMLDLLRRQALTTGGLAEHFSMSRFGVMKHLEVLTEARLVIVRREGRERWNHLNAVPIQQIYRRWIQPFAAEPADGLLKLKTITELAQGAHSMTQISDRAFKALDIQQEIQIDATVDKVWSSLTTEIVQWWPKEFYVGQAPERFVLEPRVGGRVFEDWGDGQGVLWATILVFKKGELLQWTGDLSPDFGGPARSITSFKLVEKDGGTLLQFHDSPYGALGDNTGKELDSGWKWLLDNCFKPYAEKGTQPDRPETLVESS